MIAPLKVPSIDSELPIAIRTCGCAGVDTVSGIWEIDRNVGEAALAGEFTELDPAPISTTLSTAQASGKRCRAIFIFFDVFMMDVSANRTIVVFEPCSAT